MARAYSLDLRERVVAAVASGQSCRTVAATFGVSASTVVKWSQRRRETGSVAARHRGGSKPRALKDVEDWLLERVAAEPHVTTRALAAELAEQGRRVSHVTVWNRLRRERLTHKKTVHASEQDRPDVARFRQRWKAHQDRIDPRRLVFIDETWAKTNMAPLRGWSRCGERLIAKVPHGHWKTMTFVAALRCDRIDAPCVSIGFQ
jgi:transposase